MSDEIVLSRLAVTRGRVLTPTVLRLLGISFHRSNNFWRDNQSDLHYLYHDFTKAARRVLADNHPDAGGENEMFVTLNEALLGVHRSFNKRGIPDHVSPLPRIQRFEARKGLRECKRQRHLATMARCRATDHAKAVRQTWANSPRGRASLRAADKKRRDKIQALKLGFLFRKPPQVNIAKDDAVMGRQGLASS